MQHFQIAPGNQREAKLLTWTIQAHALLPSCKHQKKVGNNLACCPDVQPSWRPRSCRRRPQACDSNSSSRQTACRRPPDQPGTAHPAHHVAGHAVASHPTDGQLGVSEVVRFDFTRFRSREGGTRAGARARGAAIDAKVIFNDPEAHMRRIREERRAERLSQGGIVSFRKRPAYLAPCPLRKACAIAAATALL